MRRDAPGPPRGTGAAGGPRTPGSSASRSSTSSAYWATRCAASATYRCAAAENRRGSEVLSAGKGRYASARARSLVIPSCVQSAPAARKSPRAAGRNTDEESPRRLCAVRVAQMSGGLCRRAVESMSPPSEVASSSTRAVRLQVAGQDGNGTAGVAVERGVEQRPVLGGDVAAAVSAHRHRPAAVELGRVAQPEGDAAQPRVGTASRAADRGRPSAPRPRTRSSADGSSGSSSGVRARTWWAASAADSHPRSPEATAARSTRPSTSTRASVRSRRSCRDTGWTR